MKQIKGPKTPKFAQMIEWNLNPLQLMEKSVKTYGDTFQLSLFGDRPLVFVSHPQAIKEIFTANPDNFDVGRGNEFLAPLVGKQSLLLLDGVQHKRHRKLLMPPFHGNRMKSYGELICEITKEVISNWKINEPFEIGSYMKQINRKVILQAVFGLNKGERYEEVEQLIGSILGLSDSTYGAMQQIVPFLQKDLGAWSPWGKFVRQQKRLDDLFFAEIQERRNNPDLCGEDILSLMTAARDEQGQPMTDQEIRDELMTLSFAGNDTTVSALTWAFYWIHHLPEVRKKLLAELDAVDNGENSNTNTITKLPYLNGLCAETLRIYPIFLITPSRITKAPIKIMDCEYPAETRLVPCIYLTHHREDLYPEPKQFKPERFIEKKYSDYEYLPFGGSNRTCIGRAFVWFQMKLVLATVLRNFDLSIVNNHQVKPILRTGTILAPSSGKWLIATGKRDVKVEELSLEKV